MSKKKKQPTLEKFNPFLGIVGIILIFIAYLCYLDNAKEQANLTPAVGEVVRVDTRMARRGAKRYNNRTVRIYELRVLYETVEGKKVYATLEEYGKVGDILDIVYDPDYLGNIYLNDPWSILHDVTALVAMFGITGLVGLIGFFLYLAQWLGEKKEYEAYLKRKRQ